MLLQHQVLHSLHHKLGACIHHSGEQPAGGGGEGREEVEEEEEDKVRLVV